MSCTCSVDSCVLLVVILPPRETDVPSIVIALLASLEFPIAASEAKFESAMSDNLATGTVPDVSKAALWLGTLVKNGVSLLN